ncbi:hypothetical protein [Ruegeria sp.]|uniref:hypothetical protein n=1 Tax=Ruegeria sp. TaxID=1879320 RepID=UPI003C7CE40C
MTAGVYYASYTLLGERNLGSHEQVRYVQGDVDELFVRHGGTWHRLPRGGIIAGARSDMVVASPLTHRAVDVTLEFGRRLVDGHADEPSYAKEKDVFYYYVNLRRETDQTKSIYLKPPEGEQVEVDFTNLDPQPKAGRLRANVITNEVSPVPLLPAGQRVIASYGHAGGQPPDLFHVRNTANTDPVEHDSVPVFQGEAFILPSPYLVATGTMLKLHVTYEAEYTGLTNQLWLQFGALMTIKVRLLGKVRP